MSATLNVGQAVGDFRVEEFVKISSDNRRESYFVRGKNGEKALMKLFAADYERMHEKFERQTPRRERRRVGF